ncbi:hypothetical protein FOA52_011864 [Chlamydomonas sp. UWO 241]|nr:hypothetical protein FOA52_011864 [Chlamydomonas sp. UWO 241]
MVLQKAAFARMLVVVVALVICVSFSSQGYYVEMEQLVREVLQKCLPSASARALHLMLPLDTDGQPNALLAAFADTWRATVGGNVIGATTTFIPYRQLSHEVEFMLANEGVSSDGWLMESRTFGTVLGGGLGLGPATIADLTERVKTDSMLDWNGIVPYVRERMAVYGGRVYGIPMSIAGAGGLFYRKDLFLAHGLSPPETWDDVAAIAAYWNSTKTGARGNATDAMCMRWRTECGEVGNNLLSVAAPYLQYRGLQQGLYFEPSELISGNPQESILINNAAMRHALSMYATFANSGPWPRPPSANPVGPCVELEEAKRFSRGECLMVVGSNTFKVIHNSPNFDVANVGVVPTPGAARVLYRATNVLVNCTPALCPYAVQSVDPATGAVRWVNRAPVWHSISVSCISSVSPPEYQNLSYEFMRTLALPGLAWIALLSKDLPETLPYRTEHFTNIKRWRDAGYHEDIAPAWLTALHNEFKSNNSVPDLRVAGIDFIELMMGVYRDGAGNASLMRGVDGLVNTMDMQMRALLRDTSKTNMQLLRSSYATMVEYLAPPAPPLLPSSPLLSVPEGESTRPPLTWLPVVIVLPIVGLLLLIAATAVNQVRNMKQHKNMWGETTPPPAGPDTAIVVAEVDGGAALWDMLPAEVMDEAMLRMCGALDALMCRHSGYHSGNMRALHYVLNTSKKQSISDSNGRLVFAFHELKDALAFTMDAQSALLNVRWPAELLLVPVCAPLYVQLVRFDLAPRQRSTLFDPRVRDDLNWETATDGDGAPTASLVSRMLPSRFRSRRPSIKHDWATTKVNQAIPALTKLPLRITLTFAEACRRVWTTKSVVGGLDRVLVMRGLALNMGIHTGLCKADVAPNGFGGGRGVTYLGPSVDAARAIVRAAQLTSSGGLVLMDEETYKRLPLERLWDKHLVLHVGEYILAGSISPASLYYVLRRSLEGRLGLHTAAGGAETATKRLAEERMMHASASERAALPSRTGSDKSGGVRQLTSSLPRQLDAGVFTAPVGLVTVAFMNVVGAQTLLSWDAHVAQPALKRFHGVVSELLRQYDGYLIEAVDGLFLASFASPATAIPWALKCNEAMLGVDWGDALLHHSLCEELFISSPARGGHVTKTVVFRGLRLKVGIDIGQVLSEVHAMAGRLTYRGKAMNRAARIASTAQSGQVLCSSDAWEVAAANLEPSLNVSATSLGECRLKGVSTNMELFHCRMAVDVRRRKSVMHSGPWAAAAAALLSAEVGDGVVGTAHVSAVPVDAAGGHHAKRCDIVASDSGVLVSLAGGGVVGDADGVDCDIVEPHCDATAARFLRRGSSDAQPVI